jgi:hypothetical protein
MSPDYSKNIARAGMLSQIVWGVNTKAEADAASQNWATMANKVMTQFIDFGHIFDTLKQRFGSTLFATMLPQLEKFQKMLLDNMPLITKYVDNAAWALGKFVEFIGNVFVMMAKAPESIKVFVGAFTGLKLGMALMSSPIFQFVTALTALLLLLDDYQHWKADPKTAKIDWGPFDKGLSSVGEMLKPFKGVLDAINAILAPMDKWLCEMTGIKGLATGITEALILMAGPTALGLLLKGFKTLAGSMLGLKGGAKAGVGIVEAIAGVVTSSTFLTLLGVALTTVILTEAAKAVHAKLKEMGYATDELTGDGKGGPRVTDRPHTMPDGSVVPVGTPIEDYIQHPWYDFAYWGEHKDAAPEWMRKLWDGIAQGPKRGLSPLVKRSGPRPENLPAGGGGSGEHETPGAPGGWGWPWSLLGNIPLWKRGGGGAASNKPEATDSDAKKLGFNIGEGIAQFAKANQFAGPGALVGGEPGQVAPAGGGWAAQILNGAGSIDGIGGGGSGSGGVDQGDAIKTLSSYFQSQGWTPEQTAGIIANLHAESGLNPHGKLGDGGKAAGLAQWHPDRQATFRQVMGKSVAEASLLEQAQFVQWELTHTEANAGRILRGQTSARGAGGAVSAYFERPGDREGEMAKRGAWAQNLLLRGMGGGGPFLGADPSTSSPGAASIGAAAGMGGGMGMGGGGGVTQNNSTTINIAPGPNAKATADNVLGIVPRIHEQFVRNVEGMFRA